MSIVTIFEALLLAAALVVLIGGFWFPRTRLGRGRWLAAGIAILEPGQLLSTYANHHEWSPRRQIAVNYFELVCDLAYVVCTAIFLVQIAWPREKSRTGRANRPSAKPRTATSTRR
ncbi:MAG: hypothetical protein ACTHKL_01545 [Streptosporangiaceae bacterium]